MICVECNRTVIGSERCPLCDADTTVPERKPVEAIGFKNRPGTALASLIPKWAASQRNGCQCKNYRVKMDKWGTDVCSTDRFDEIVSHMLQQEKHLISPLRTIPDTMKGVLAKALVSWAIRKSRKD